MFCYLETSTCHFSPEILVLLDVFINARGVADDAETHKRYALDVARVSDGARFHIYGKSLREVCLNGI